MPGLLSHSPANIITRLLIQMVHGTLPTSQGAWPIHTDAEPDLPDNCLTIKDTDGIDHGRNMVTGERQGQYGIQVRVRSTTSSVGYTKANSILVALNSEVYDEEITLDSVTYRIHSCYTNGDVISLGKDKPDSRRSLHTLNALVNLRKLA